jgi:hypothetical protein
MGHACSLARAAAPVPSSRPPSRGGRRRFFHAPRDDRAQPRQCSKWWLFTTLERTKNGWTVERNLLVDVTKIRAVAEFQDPETWRRHTLLYVANLKAPLHVASHAHDVLARLEQIEGSTVRLRSLAAA